MTKLTLIAPLLASTLALGACSTNYAGEGALGGAALGAGVGAVTGRDVAESAAVGCRGRNWRRTDREGWALLPAGPARA